MAAGSRQQVRRMGGIAVRIEEHPAPPMIGVPMGDPGGIGPEIAVLAALSPVLCGVARPLLIGGPEVVARTEALLATALVVAEVDVLRGWADLAREANWCQPLADATGAPVWVEEIRSQPLWAEITAAVRHR